jgi:hypothetical protein
MASLMCENESDFAEVTPEGKEPPPRVRVTPARACDHGFQPNRLGGARVRIDPADAGKHELSVGGGAGRVRARELHEGAELVCAANGRPAEEDIIATRESQHTVRGIVITDFRLSSITPSQ